jgi:hypothetical protein
MMPLPITLREEADARQLIPSFMNACNCAAAALQLCRTDGSLETALKEYERAGEILNRVLVICGKASPPATVILVAPSTIK